MQNVFREADRELALRSSHSRYVALDSLRGLAAMAVVLVHSYEDRGFIPNGQLAVDLFFILSGFVVSHSYEKRLAAGMSLRSFCEARIARLYPMLLLGAIGGVLIALIHNQTNTQDAYPLKSLIISATLSILCLPYLGSAINERVFSFNAPMWSLFFEAVINIVYGLSYRLSTKAIGFVTGLGLLGVLALGPNGGGAKDIFLAGFPRVVAGFFAGVLLFRLHNAQAIPRIKLPFPALAACLILAFAIRPLITNILYIPAMLILWIIVAAAIQAPSSRFDRYGEFLGLVSYPVYLLHWLTLYIFTWIGARVGVSGEKYHLVVIGHFLIIPFIGYLAARYYETPACLWLKAKLNRRKL